MIYRKTYGGAFGAPPDMKRCAASVGYRLSQCQNKAIHDPEEVYGGAFTTCGVHCKKAEEKRQAKTRARLDAQTQQWEERQRAHQKKIDLAKARTEAVDVMRSALEEVFKKSQCPVASNVSYRALLKVDRILESQDE